MNKDIHSHSQQKTAKTRSNDATVTYHAAPGDSGSLLGRQLGAYRIEEKLGEGGMGVIYKAVHTKLDKIVALKILPPQLTQLKDSVARFEREMKSVGKLDHPHIVRALDAGEIGGTHYLAMEYIDGQDLRKLVEEVGPLSVPLACRIVRQAALALSAAHAAGLIHRDIKPTNLLYSRAGQTKLLDLGLARLADSSDERTELTLAGETFGTPDFMAPEQWEDARSVDQRTDLYALGCTLYYLLVGRAPFANESCKSTVAKMRAHVSAPVPDLMTACPAVPERLNLVYKKLMAKQPIDRLPTANELADALLEFVPATGFEQPTLHESVATVREIPCTTRPSGFLRSATQGSVRSPKNWNLLTRLVMVSLALLLVGSVAGVAIVYQYFSITPNRPSDGSQPSPTHSQMNVIGQQGAGADDPSISATGRPSLDPAAISENQRTWAQMLDVGVEFSNSVGMQFRLIPPGKFLMGSSQVEIEKIIGELESWDHDWIPALRSEGPQRAVEFTSPFYIGVHEVTQSEYARVMNSNPSFFAKTGTDPSYVEIIKDRDTFNHPVDGVTWGDAKLFCAKLSALEQQSGHPSPVSNYRLPTEAEWEYACRAGSQTRFWLGNGLDALAQIGWFGSNSNGSTNPVGQLLANPFGLYDTHGNVWEWVDGSGLDEQPIGGSEPIGGSVRAGVDSNEDGVVEQVIRGGGWRQPELGCRSASRDSRDVTNVSEYIGFRVVAELKAEISAN